MGDKEDKPENYNLVTYALKETDGYTRVALTQDNIATEEEKQHAQSNWEGVLKELKKVAEAE
jgi:Activator of Hsp90 ATPase homolog 1-like protein